MCSNNQSSSAQTPERSLPLPRYYFTEKFWGLKEEFFLHVNNKSPLGGEGAQVP